MKKVTFKKIEYSFSYKEDSICDLYHKFYIVGFEDDLGNYIGDNWLSFFRLKMKFYFTNKYDYEAS